MEPEKTPRERASKFIKDLVTAWRPSRDQVLWASRIVLVLAALLAILALIGLPFGITLWAWVKLLIVPAVIAGGGLWFTQQQQAHEIQLAEQRSQDEALQAYLDHMSDLLLTKRLRSPQGSSGEARLLARAR